MSQKIFNDSVKNDEKDGKIRMDLIPLPVLEEIAKVFTAGAKKYGENRWQNLDNGYERYKGALLRHLTEIEKGNEIDADTGCMHIAQVATNAIFMTQIITAEIAISLSLQDLAKNLRTLLEIV